MAIVWRARTGMGAREAPILNAIVTTKLRVTARYGTVTRPPGVARIRARRAISVTALHYTPESRNTRY